MISPFLLVILSSVPKCTLFVLWNFTHWLSTIAQVRSTLESGYFAFGCFLCSSVPKPYLEPAPVQEGTLYTGPGEFMDALCASCLPDRKTFCVCVSLEAVPKENAGNVSFLELNCRPKDGISKESCCKAVIFPSKGVHELATVTIAANAGSLAPITNYTARLEAAS